jgi:GT2 family glycosyltransferase
MPEIDFHKQKKKLIVVLGMHRSGTSVITRGLQVFGVELGDQLMPANASDNPTGYWEDLDVNALNIKILEALRSDWQRVTPIDADDVTFLCKKGFLLKAVELLRKKSSGTLSFGFKDPRLSLLLPFWREAFKNCADLEVIYVITARNPLSVVMSLGKRGVNPIHGYLMWFSHVLESLKSTWGEKHVVVDYDKLLADPSHELGRIAKSIGLEIDFKALYAYEINFLRKDLRHTFYKNSDLAYDISCPQIIREIHAETEKISADFINSDLQKKIAQWCGELNRVGAFLRLIDENRRYLSISNERVEELNSAVCTRDGQISNLRRAVEERESEIEGLIKTITERDGQIASLSQVLEKRDRERDGQTSNLSLTVKELEGEIEGLTQTIVVRDGQIASLNQVIEKRDREIEGLTRTITLRDGQISTLSLTVKEQEGEIEGLTLTITERDDQIAFLTDETVRRGQWALGLDAELKEARAMIQRIITSNSWQITKPLREARRWISLPAWQSKRYAGAGLRFAKRAYKTLPFSPKMRKAHTSLILRYAPQLLLASSNPAQTLPIISDEQLGVAVPPLATSEQPIVSIIIPVYGKVEFTLRCLSSIAKHLTQAPFEIIVVDDCSPDETVAVLAEIRGVQLLKNEENQGFIRSCNAAAKIARGDYLHFLNNDTEVTSGWLDELLHTFTTFPGTGLAGSKLVFPDGLLQEAGGIIWQDGSAWNFGRYQDPLLPIYNYAREVDYCSGASIMVPKGLFEELGGFDELYLPAYCEDSDLALKIRAKGYRVIYQPLSTVVHYEGITSGTDITQGVKAYQAENSRKLFDRWHYRLEKHQAPGDDAINAKDRRATRRALMLDHCTPTPDQDSGSIDAYNHLLLLREMDFQVTFIPEDNFLYMPYYTSALQRAGVEVLYAPHLTSVKQHLRAHGDRYDLVFINRPAVFERHISDVRKYCHKAKVIFHTVDLHFLRMSRETIILNSKEEINNSKKESVRMKKGELSFISKSDIATVTSTEEIEIVNKYLPNSNIRLLPYARSIEGRTEGFFNRRDIVFVGGYRHPPNCDAVKYFLKEIMPILRERLPGIRFYVVGSNPTKEIKSLASEDVIITDFVEELTPLLNKMRISVAPLRYGAGIKGKIGTAMAVGLPVVATSLAAEGMSLSDGENILIADGAEAFADAITKVYLDEALWEHISDNGLSHAVKAWGGETAFKVLSSILTDLGFSVRESPYPIALYSDSLPRVR